MKFVSMTAVAALVAGAAHAGGIAPAPSEPMVMAPAPVMTMDDWTGGYAGLSLGYGTVDQDGIDALEDEDDSFAGVDFDIDGDGAIGGIYGGYQYDFGSFVLGAEADLNAANLDFDDDGIGDFIDEGTSSFDDNGGVSIDNIYRLKARAGYDAGSTLIYGVLGWAYAEATFYGQDYSDYGAVAGLGLDYKFNTNMTVGGEVLYHQWDDFDDTGVDLDATTFQARLGYSF